MAHGFDTNTMKKIPHGLASDAVIPGVLINPDYTEVEGHPVEHWAVAGKQLRLKNPAQRAAADAQKQAALQKQRQDHAEQLLNKSDDALMAIVLSLLDEVDELRQTAGLPPKTKAERITAVRGKVVA